MAISHFNKRRKEMAMIKILGSNARQLFSGFFTESFIFTLVSMAATLVIIEIIIGHVNIFLNVELTMLSEGDWFLFAIIGGVFLITALMSGLFPSLYFVYTPAVRLLVTRFYTGRKTAFLKKALMAFQFSIATFMIAASFVVYGHFRYMERFDPGYDVENIVSY
jgi:putative ABC transport system permease protein